MASIRDRLEKILPEHLPTDPSDAILAHHLYEKIKHLFPDVSPNSIKQSFSIMASDPSSCLAKRPGRHGYFKKSENYTSEASNVGFYQLKKTSTKKIVKSTVESELFEDIERLERSGELLTFGINTNQSKILKKINTLAAGRFHPAIQKRRK